MREEMNNGCIPRIITKSKRTFHVHAKYVCGTFLYVTNLDKGSTYITDMYVEPFSMLLTSRKVRGTFLYITDIEKGSTYIPRMYVEPFSMSLI